MSMAALLLSANNFYLAFRGLVSAWPFYLLLGVGWLLYSAATKRRLPSFVRPFKNNWGLAILSFFVWLSIAEIALRFYGKYATAAEQAEVPLLRYGFILYQSPYLPHDQNGLMVYSPNLPPRPSSFSNAEFNYPKPTNSLGLMDREWNRARTKQHRFVFLGDSYTEGVGSAFDSSFVNHFERMAGDSIEMLNAGIASSDPFFEYALFQKRIVDEYKPDRIYVTINATDITDVMTRGGMERFQPDGTVRYKSGPWWELLYSVSVLARGSIHLLYDLDWMLLTKARAAEERKIATQKLETLLDTFQQMGNARGVKVYFVFHALFEDIKAGRLIATEPLLNYARGKNYLTVNLLQTFIDHGVNEQNSTVYFWPIDGHYKNEGYQLMAKGLLRSL